MGALKVILLYQLLVACLNMEPKTHHLGLAKKSKSHLVFSSLVSATGKWPNPTWRGHVNIEPSLKRTVVSRLSFSLLIGRPMMAIIALLFCLKQLITFFSIQGWIKCLGTDSVVDCG